MRCVMTTSFIADIYDEKNGRLVDTYEHNNDIGIVKIHNVDLSFDYDTEVVLCELDSNDLPYNDYVDYRKMTYCVFEHRNGKTTNNPEIFSSSKEAIKYYGQKIIRNIRM